MTTQPQHVAQPRPRPSWWAALLRQPLAVLTAIRFLTRVPIPELFFPPAQEPAVLLRASVVYFPLVGSLVGMATAGVIVGAGWLWPAWLAVVVGLTFEALLTGAFHE